MEKGTLTFENIDFDLLERQRLELVDVVTGTKKFKDCVVLEGLLNMLDEWSDKRLAEKKSYQAIEEQVAVAMTDAMDQKGMWELAYQDNLKTLNDCTEQELLEFEETYLGKKVN